MLGSWQRTQSTVVALVNGTLSHSLDYDDHPGICHIGAVIVPASLAVAEEEKADGRKPTTTVNVGYDVVTRVQEAFDGEKIFARGFLSDSGAVSVHNPSSNLRLHSRISPVIPMIRRGITVGLRTDATGQNEDDDMIQEMRLAWTLHRVPGVRSECLSSSQVLDMATAGSARATGVGSEIGSIEVGRKADLVLLDARGMLWPYTSSRIPLLDVMLQSVKASDVDTVIVDGEVLFEGGKFEKLDMDKVVGELTKSIADEKGDRARLAENLRNSLREFYGRWDGSKDYVHNSRGSTQGPHSG